MTPETLCAIRYGYGLTAGGGAPAASARDLLAQLSNPDPALTRWQEPTTGARIAEVSGMLAVQKAYRAGQLDEAGYMADRRRIAARIAADYRQRITRPVVAAHGFTERLAAFWADHFTVSALNRQLALVQAPYHADAIRPHLAGRFGDMLVAVVTHPAMLTYLDQTASVGPASRVGKRTGKGLNENLAREVLELHTLGVSAAYGQDDVRQLAELFTGLRVDTSGFDFKERFAEPGAETVLGKSYGGAKARLADITSALHDIALHPATAAHLARKLAVHFVADLPPPSMVDAIASAYLGSGGSLRAAYAALLDHPQAWAPDLAKVKPPFDFVVSALRAFGVGQTELDGLDARALRRGIAKPMEAMGQALMRPRGPDGWPEDAAAWITPATLSARIEWSAALARKYGEGLDPRGFLKTALSDAASEGTAFAISGAETKWEGVALVLASPEFNRR